jgi:seryl-tRNA(Sec) selenium transferase
MSNTGTKGLFTRRGFLRWSQAAMAVIGAFPMLGGTARVFGAAHTTEEAGSSEDDYYAKLNVKKIMNAAGTYTDLTGSLMPPQVQRAVARAALHPVLLKELQTNAGEYIAKKLRCEGAMVSCGASSALTLGTAACMQAANGCKPTDIPELIGTARFPKNEIVVQKAHRYGYDHAMFLCGAKFVEVETVDEYKRAFTSNTFMTNFNNAASIQDLSSSISSPKAGKIQHKEWLDVAHQHNIPCLIDVASDMPPIDTLWKYTGMGFDLVAISGGKGMRGPQNAGILMGKKRLTDLAAANNNPGDGVGRGMKVAKEQIVGMVAAVDWILEQTDEGMTKEFKRREDVIWSMLKDIPTIQATTFTPPEAEHAPVLKLTFDPAVLGITPVEVQDKLNELGRPIVLATTRLVPVESRGNSIGVSTWTLNPGDEIIVGRELRKTLRSGKTPMPAKS